MYRVGLKSAIETHYIQDCRSFNVFLMPEGDRTETQETLLVSAKGEQPVDETEPEQKSERQDPDLMTWALVKQRMSLLVELCAGRALESIVSPS